MSGAVEIELVFADETTLYTQRMHFNYEPQVIEVIKLNSNIPTHALKLSMSVWGKVVNNATILKNNDRLEFTRDLVADPKHSRARKVNAKPRRGWVLRIR